MTKATEHFDTIIIGGGPAGMSAALWCADLGIKAVLLEKEAKLGGQLLWTFNKITNYLGVEAENGRELRDRFLQHIGTKRVSVLTGGAVQTADLTQRTVELFDGRTFLGRAIIIATGVRRRKLAIPGEDEFRGRGVLGSGVRDRDQVSGKRVVIVGGGDAALENAVILGRTAANVTLVHRRNEFSARREFVDAVRENARIEIVLGAQVTRIIGNEKVEAVEIVNNDTRETLTIGADAVLIRIGVVPNSELFRDQIELDDAGYIVAAQSGSTRLSGIYAAGDVAHPHAPTVSTAAGSSATAVRSLFTWLSDA